MKRIYLSVLLCSGVSLVHAQLSQGGLPLSISSPQIRDQQVEIAQFPTPDFESILKKELEDEAHGVAKPYMVSTYIPVNISINNSGTWSYFEDGRKTWRLAVSIPEAKAIAILYDKFYLPEGVQLFLTNKNKKQLLGAFTSANNSADGLFINEPVQGDLAFLEMNIAADVDPAAIALSIDRLSAYYRGVEDLEMYAVHTDDAVVLRPTDEMPGTSPCHKNALCPIPGKDADQYKIPMDATVKITISGGSGGQGHCSGTLINNTGNSNSGVCQPLLLTASHCDGSNSYNSSDFSQWQFRFHYQYTECTGTTLNSPSPTLNGANFKARSHYPSFQTPNNSLVSDFLLLELSSPIPDLLETNLVGWNRQIDISSDEEYYDFFIGFHHPNGDVKKKSWGNYVSPSGRFNQTTVPATHWNIPFTYGGTQGGSSGSGLFDVDGLLIGDLSGGTSASASCGEGFGTHGLYSKLSYAWENQFDQTNFPQYAGAQSRLKDWLDPKNTGVMTLQSVKSDCSDMSNVRINDLQNELERSINIYPNPSTTGFVKAKINFVQLKDVRVTIYNSLGNLQKEYFIPNVVSGDYSFDCSDLANGIYLMKFNADGVEAGKKIVLTK